MNRESDYLPGFLEHIGIKGVVQRDDRNIPLIIIETKLFNQRRAWIETWFQLVEERADFCYFRERIRGSEDTR